jgi:hypothetical protein
MTRWLGLGLGFVLRTVGVLGILTCSFSLDSLPMEPTVAQAGKAAGRRFIKRGRVQRGKRPPPQRGAIVSLPPLRDSNGGGTSIMLATAAPTGAGKGAVVMAAPPPSPGKSPTPPPVAPAPPVKGNATLAARKKKGPPTDEELMEDAQAAYVRGDRGKAIELALIVAEKSTDRSPSAWKFIGLAACSVRSYRLATRAYQGVKTPYDQRAIADACKYNGLSYKGDQFVGD